MKKISSVMVCLFVISLVISMVFISGCAEEKEIKLGAILPLSGNTAWLGEQHKWGIDLAVEEINSKGSISGRKLVIIYEDDQNDAKTAVNAYQKLVTTVNPALIITAMSSSSMAVYPLAEKDSIVLYANCGHPEIANLSVWVFRDFLTAKQEAETMAQICYERLNVKKLALLYIDDAYGVGGKESFKKTYKGKILTQEKYDKNGTDFRTEITKVLSKRPPAIYVFGYGNATAEILRQLKQFGYKGLILGTNNFTGPPVADINKEILKGSIFTAPQFGLTESDFSKRIIDKFGKEPQWNTAVEYDAIFMIAEALRKSEEGLGGEPFRRALLNVGDYKGIAGQYTLNADGEWILELELRTYQNGKQIVYESK